MEEIPKDVRIIFVVPSNCKNEKYTSDEIQYAYEACKQQGVDVQWVTEHHYKSLELRKTDFVVFQQFEGECFQNARKTKSVRIVGPWCLITCLTVGIEIPNYPWPIYSVAMRDCFITCSSIPKPQRKKIQEKVEYMGGCCIPNLVSNCTHLITDSVISEKYIKATEAGMKIVLPSWVEDVWDASLKANVHCSDASFDKYRCPIFHNLTISCTGFNQIQRNEFDKIITENGGKYSEALHLKTTDVLVCESISNSAKYKAARKHPKIKCVTVQWIEDSIKKMYSVSVDLYPLNNITSTPTKSQLNVCPNFSMISNISSIPGFNKADGTEVVDATCLKGLSEISPRQEVTTLKRKSSVNEHNMLVDKINLKEMKRIGQFLDGCNIYLVGFGSEQREKLCKILNYSGATRYDQFSERVTHVLVGDPSCNEVKLVSSTNGIKNCCLVSIQWLLESIEKKQPADEENYILNIIPSSADELASPLSKKGLQLLNENSKKSKMQEGFEVSGVPVPSPEREIDIVQQYLLPTISSQEDTLAKILRDQDQFKVSVDTTLTVKSDLLQTNQRKSSHSNSLQNERNDLNTDTIPPNASKLSKDASISSAVDESSQLKPIFEGLRFTVADYPENGHEQIKEAIEAMNGKVVSLSYKGIPDYGIIPMFRSEFKKTATEIVTHLWIFDCYEDGELKPINYFHRPISIKENTELLKGCVITMSNYTSYERQFLRSVIGQLGGTVQEQFSRTNTEKTVASTHLICPEASGKKYAAAIKWGVPVVTKDWLLECARTSSIPPVNEFSLNHTVSENITVERAKKSLSPGQSLIKPNNVAGSSKDSISSVSFKKDSNVDLNFSIDAPIKNNFSISTNKSFNNSAEKNLDMSIRVNTPENRILRDVKNTSGVCSQITPVQSIIAEARKQNLLGTPESIPYPKAWDHVDTPDTPLGAFIRPNPSPNLRKQMVRYLNTFPDHKSRRDSTPLSELKRRLWNNILPSQDFEKAEQPNFDSEEENFGVTQPSKSDKLVHEDLINNQLQQLQDLLASSNNSAGKNLKNKRQSTIPVAASNIAKDSQPNTVGWDDYMDCEAVQQPPKVSVFMLSNIEQEKREAFVVQLEHLGAVVSNLSTFDPLVTHLICQKPPRNEKVLACMAAGKWILHISYIEKCISVDRLVDEEYFEFGNPKFMDNIRIQFDADTENRMASVYYWRKEIMKRGYGAFYDMKAIVVVQKKESIVRIIEAGGGIVVHASPPYTQTIHATVCILDSKVVTDFSDYIPLAKQGIYCVNIFYINEFLHRTTNDIRNHIVPQLASYYEFE